MRPVPGDREDPDEYTTSMSGTKTIPSPGILSITAMLFLAAVCFAIYSNGLHGPFFFDDLISIRDNPNVRSLTPLSDAIGARPGSGSSGRPLVALSLAINYAFGGLDVFGYHLLNVCVHALTALALFALVRRVLAATVVGGRALPLAFGTALLWAVHPLHTDALDQVVYRNEALAALFYLGALYGAVRSFGSDRPIPWYLLSVVSCALAMASKEIAISAPLAILALDRTLFARGFIPALRQRRLLYLGLATTWLVLALSIASGYRGESVGFDQECTSGFEYLTIQSWAIVHYLRLAVWPYPLLVDYFAWPVPSSLVAALPQGLTLLALLAASAWFFVRRRLSGFLGLLFFAVLAPSSSIYPLSGELVAEHRTYLPLAPVILLLVLGVDRLLDLARVRGRLTNLVTAVLLVLIASTLAWRTVVRNEQYRDVETIWETVLGAYPDHARAHRQLTAYYLGEGRAEEALRHAREAARIEPGLGNVQLLLAKTLVSLGRAEEAMPHYRSAVQQRPDSAKVYAEMALGLKQLGRLGRAETAFRQAIELDPSEKITMHNLAGLLIERRNYPDAERIARQALAIDPDYIAATHDLGAALLNQGRSAEAVPYFRRALESDPGNARREEALAIAMDHAGDAAGAIDHYRKSLQIEARRATAHGLARLLSAHSDPALRNGEEALQLMKGLISRAGREDPQLLDLLSMAQAELGRFDAALASARRALALFEEAGATAAAAQVKTRIARYESRQPHRL